MPHDYLPHKLPALGNEHVSYYTSSSSDWLHVADAAMGSFFRQVLRLQFRRGFNPFVVIKPLCEGVIIVKGL